MQDWNDNENMRNDDLEDAANAVLEVARDLPDALVFGVVQALVSPAYFPAFVLGHLRRGLRDLRAELEKWHPPVEPF